MHYLVLDLEMTGTEPGWHEIIQIGAVLYDQNWQELGRYLQNVYPENEDSFSLPAQEVHGLSEADLEDAPMIYEVLPEFETWILQKIGKYQKGEERFQYAQKLRNVIICGQSVINDINFMRVAYREEKLDWPFSYKLLDLHTLSYFLFEILKENQVSTPKSLSLTAIAAHFGLAREGEEHNALEDAVITGACLREVMAFKQQLKLQV